MTVDEFIDKPLDEVVSHFDMKNITPVVDADGNIVKLIFEYVPKKVG